VELSRCRLIFLLTFGIYAKSRVAAVGMFIYSMISKLMVWGAAASVDGTVLLPGVLLGIVVLYLYFEGARGTIAYHRLRSERVLPDTCVGSSEE
jgi:hypothetical protein